MIDRYAMGVTMRRMEKVWVCPPVRCTTHLVFRSQESGPSPFCKEGGRGKLYYFCVYKKIFMEYMVTYLLPSTSSIGVLYGWDT